MADGEVKIKVSLDTENVQSQIKDLTSKIEKQTSSIGKAFSSVGAGIVDISKKIAVGIGAGVTAFGALSVKALQLGGDLEQSIGGIETLFKTSADTVITNSKKAYKTAGIDANTYMQQVTSFSASLLQSLGGDTAKAAKVADMAVIDMADNANKMGSTIESIQYAYQGFAKQNYTMLDNLKLGYGGTKTEMERLLKDAEKITGKKYNLSNLNDVYQAIHVIQDELGITGTTALEAEKTLTGAFGSAKAAFVNFLSGAGDTNAFVDSFINLTDIVIDRMQELIPRLATGLIEIAQKSFEKLKTRLPKSIQKMFDNIPNIGKMIGDKLSSPEFNTQLDKIKKSFSNLFDKIPSANILNSIISAFGNFTVTLIDLSTKAIPPVLDFFSWLIDNLPSLTPLIAGIGGAFAAIKIGGIVTQIASFVSSIGGLTSLFSALGAAIAPVIAPIALVAAAIGTLVAIVVHLWQTNEEFKNSIIESWNNISASISGIIESIKSIFNGFIQSLSESGTLQTMATTFTGIWESIKETVSTVVTSIADLFESVFGAINTFLSEHKEEITTGLAMAWEFAWGIIEPILTIMKQSIENIGVIVGATVDIITGILEGDWNKVWTGLGNIVETAKKDIDTKIKALETIIKNIFNNIKNTALTIWEELKISLPKKAETIKTEITKFFNELPYNIGVALGKLFNEIVNFGVKFLNWVKNDFPKIITDFINEFIKLPEKIGNELNKAIKNVIGFGNNVKKEFQKIDLFEIGKNLIQGLINGIGSMKDSVVNSVNDLVQGIKDSFTGVKGLDIHSPSKWAEEIGVNVDKGLAKGFKKGSKETIAAANELIDQLKFSLNMGYISEEDFYNKIGEISNKFFEKNSSEWRQYTLDIYNYEKEKNQKIIDESKEFAENASKELQKRYQEEEKSITTSLQNTQKTFSNNYSQAAQSVEDAYKRIDISADNSFINVKNIVKDAYADMEISVDDFFTESGIIADDTNQKFIDNIKEELTAFEDSHRQKIAMKQEEILMANFEYDQESKRIQDEIKAIDDLTKAEDKASRRQEKLTRIEEYQQQISVTEDPEKTKQLQEKISDIRVAIAREDLLESREQQKNSLKIELEAAKEKRQSKVDAAKAEIKELEDTRTTFYTNEISSVKLQYEELNKAAEIQANKSKSLENKTQQELLSILDSYKQSYYDKGAEQGQAYYDGLKKWLDQAANLSATPNGNINTGSLSVPAFATEGRATRPMLAIVGDTPDAEYMLREGTLKSLLQSAIASTMNYMTQNHINNNYSNVFGTETKEVIVQQTNNFYEPQESYYKTAKQQLKIGQQLGEQINAI